MSTWDDPDERARPSGFGGDWRGSRPVFDDPMSWSLPIMRVARISVRVHLFFLVFVVVLLTHAASVTSDGAVGVRPTLLGLAGLFLVVLLHEFGHCIACRMVGGTANEILLWPLGGLASCDPPERPRAHFWTAVGGPLVNVALIALLTPLLGWLRYVPPNGDAPFEALMLENAARCPPGSSSGVPMWRPFDMKGIRLYPHERRFAETFGARGLSVPARRAAELRRSLEADVRFLTDHGLVDFSYLISVWVAGPARDCDEVARDVEAAAAAAAVAVRASRTSASLIPAMYQLADVAPPPQQQALSPPQQQQALSPPQQQCVPVVLRMALIDYLREWMLLELFEDFRKTISRDLVAGERNHAVVPVAEFGQRFVSYFGEQLIRPLPATGLPLNLLSWASGTLRACAAVRLRWPQMRG